MHAMVVPGSGLVKQQAGTGGLRPHFQESGFEWREAGCSMCLTMNADNITAGRTLRVDQQPELRRPSGRRGHTHLVSPAAGGGSGD